MKQCRKPEDLSEIADKIAELRQSELIDYAEVYPLKISVLEKLYGRFMADRGSDRRNEFRAFVEAQGDDLHKLALFQTLYDIKKYIYLGRLDGLGR